jgi:hypothetical protein
MVYIGVWSVLCSKKVKNELKLPFRLVIMRLSTIGPALWYYYTMDKRVQAYIWGIAWQLEDWTTSA